VALCECFSGFTPKQAIALSSEELKELRVNAKRVKRSQKPHHHQISKLGLEFELKSQRENWIK